MEDKTIRLFLTILCVMWLVSLVGGFILEWRQQEMNPTNVTSTEHNTPENR